MGGLTSITFIWRSWPLVLSDLLVFTGVEILLPCHPLMYMTLLCQLLYIILVEGHTHNDHSSKIKFTLLQSGSGSLEDFLLMNTVSLFACVWVLAAVSRIHCVMQEPSCIAWTL